MSEPQNVVQATGRVATSLIDGLKSQPSLLMLMILNVFMFGLIAWATDRNTDRRIKRETLILERCLPRLQQQHGTSVDDTIHTTGGTDETRP